MTGIDQLRTLWRHATWADAELLQALQALEIVPPEVLREYAHILGAEETWLARLERRPSRAVVWPTMTMAEAQALSHELGAGYSAYLSRLADADLSAGTTYTNSAGTTFSTPVGDILLQVMLHGQYHRGKVNLLLRQGGASPAPVDYIGFVRGAPAAVTPRPTSP